MKLSTLVPQILAAGLLAAAVHCKKPSEESRIASDATSQAPAVTSTPRPPTEATNAAVVTGTLAAEYRGTLGHDLAIVARLKRDGDHVNGSYFYEKSGGTLGLAGSLTASHLMLDEVVGKAKTGTIEVDLASDGTLEGVWTDPSRRRSLAAHLAPIVQEPSPPSALVFKRTRHEVIPVVGGKSKDDVCKMDLDYAEVFGLRSTAESKINARLSPPEELLVSTSCDHAVESTAGFTVAHNGHGILSVIVTSGLTDSQAAHPDASTGPVTVWIASGADVKLFGDIVDPKYTSAVRRELALSVHTLAHEAGADAEIERLVLDSFGEAPPFVIEKQGVSLCASTPHFAANLSGCQYRIPVSRLPHLRAPAVALWAK